LAQLGLTCQKPLHRALERNEALVKQWLKKEYPQIKASAHCEEDERVEGFERVEVHTNELEGFGHIKQRDS
jgi:hypothetical protein